MVATYSQPFYMHIFMQNLDREKLCNFRPYILETRRKINSAYQREETDLKGIERWLHDGGWYPFETAEAARSAQQSGYPDYEFRIHPV
jgi:hypothetical protein